MKIVPLLVEKPWGGNWLGKRYDSAKPNIGEAWLLSTLKEGESLADGRSLSKVIGAVLPFVVKIIDAAENLSVQVHPNDEWAARLENSRGKTECWLVLDAKSDAGVYLGLREGHSAPQFFKELSEGGDVRDSLRFFPVQRGDFITVPGGTVHAIGSGVTLLEVQQASGITYRLWDWNRQGRELHLEKGQKVASFDKRFTFQPRIFETMKSGVLFKHPDFECLFNESRGEGWFIDLTTYDVYHSATARSAPYLFVR
jgi:mannose-6-phosphate isomerase